MPVPVRPGQAACGGSLLGFCARAQARGRGAPSPQHRGRPPRDPAPSAAPRCPPRRGKALRSDRGPGRGSTAGRRPGACLCSRSPSAPERSCPSRPRPGSRPAQRSPSGLDVSRPRGPSTGPRRCPQCLVPGLPRPESKGTCGRSQLRSAPEGCPGRRRPRTHAFLPRPAPSPGAAGPARRGTPRVRPAATWQSPPPWATAGSVSERPRAGRVALPPALLGAAAGVQVRAGSPGRRVGPGLQSREEPVGARCLPAAPPLPQRPRPLALSTKAGGSGGRGGSRRVARGFIALARNRIVAVLMESRDVRRAS